MTIVRDNVNWKDLTEEERTIIRMWFKIGLTVEWRCADPGCDCKKIWETLATETAPPLDNFGLINYRLKP